MPQGRIQPRTWYVELGLDVSATPAFAVDGFEFEQPTAVPPSDSEIRLCIKDVMDKSNQGGRRIRSLQFVSFAYKSTDPADTTPDPACKTADIVDVVGFFHGTESILDTTIRSWIEDPRVMDQQWTPVSIQRGTSGNWRQHDTILAFFSDCERGSRARVDWLCSGDPSAPVVKGGCKKTVAPRG